MRQRDSSGRGTLFSGLAGRLFIWLGIPRDKNTTGIPIQMRSQQPAKPLQELRGRCLADSHCSWLLDVLSEPAPVQVLA